MSKRGARKPGCIRGRRREDSNRRDKKASERFDQNLHHKMDFVQVPEPEKSYRCARDN